MKVSILKSLAYFDIFEHPLSKPELVNLAGISESESVISSVLSDMVQSGVCFEYGGYYSINEAVKLYVENRKRKEALAQVYKQKLPFYTRIIKSFPFVRAITISGSLSKSVMHEKGDIDYFIITKKNRLWICRSLLILFKKIFLFNSRKYFCVNYFVDEENLEILDKNIFTAIEVSHLVPVYNETLLIEMKHKNEWIKDFFPNYVSNRFFEPLKGDGFIKRILEKIISGSFAEYLDLFLMRLTYKRWTKKFKHFNADKLELTMRSNRGISKHHPSDFQTKVLTAYQERLKRFDLSHESIIYA